jgi:2-polyprenyl-3-methyl-5-hydroxy-6-metoxy-1,4-benzoquinol methylase
MNNISNYIERDLNLKSFNSENDKNYNNIKIYYTHAKSDAIHCYQSIEKYLVKDKKILEVGGGIHLLTSFLQQDYDITSIEPGGFAGFTDDLRNKILNRHKLKVYTTTVEKFTTDAKFDFIFSMNVLEHTDDIKQHITSCMNLLKDEHSLLFIQCPNYTFPFECHFYKWFIPFMPNFTFKYLRKKSLIKQMGEDKFNNTFNFLNFNCTYFKIKKLKFPITFRHPLKNIFDRMANDYVFKERLCQNSIVNIFYKLINLLRIKKLLTIVYPKFLCPYLIMEIKNK